MKLKLTGVVLILLIVSISGCAQLKRIEQGIMKNQETLGKQGDDLAKQNAQLVDLQESVNSVNNRVGSLEKQVQDNQEKNNKRFDEIDKKVAELNKQLENCQKVLQSGTPEEKAEAEKALNQTIESGKFKLTLTVKAGKTINVRAGPSKHEKITGVLRGGETVMIEKIEGSWGKIKDSDNWCTIIHHYCRLKIESM